MIKKVLDMIYPKKCISCFEIIDEDYFCENCIKDILQIDGGCLVCGALISESEICHNCPDYKTFFDRNVAVFKYEDVKDIIHKFKYAKKPWLGKIMGKIMAEFLLDKHRDMLNLTNVMIPTPIHRKKLNARGFNQSYIMALEISKLTGIELLDGVKRVKNSKAQSLVSLEERAVNVTNAFLAIKDVSDKNILIVDDIYTTGNTINSISQELKLKGAKQVNSIAFSISQQNIDIL